MIPNIVRYNVESAGTRYLWPKSPYVHINLLILSFFTWHNCPFSINFWRLILIFCYFGATIYYQYSSHHLICWTSFMNVVILVIICFHSCSIQFEYFLCFVKQRFDITTNTMCFKCTLGKLNFPTSVAVLWCYESVRQQTNVSFVEIKIATVWIKYPRGRLITT